MALTKIIGDRHNRLLVVMPLGAALVQGGIPQDGADLLLRSGWKVYDGPATATAGWVDPGTDPNLRPRSTLHRGMEH